MYYPDVLSKFVPICPGNTTVEQAPSQTHRCNVCVHAQLKQLTMHVLFHFCNFCDCLGRLAGLGLLVVLDWLKLLWVLGALCLGFLGTLGIWKYTYPGVPFQVLSDLLPTGLADATPPPPPRLGKLPLNEGPLRKGCLSLP